VVPHGADLAKALAIAREIVTADPRVLADPAPFLGVAQIESAGIRLAVKPWVQVPDVVSAEAEFYQALAERFRAEGIDVPPARHEIRVLEGAAAR
jgi:small conductance mechanosensitive channel